MASKSLSSATLTLALATVSASFAISLIIWRRKWREKESKVRDLQEKLDRALGRIVAERQGRVRTQQALRKALANPKPEDVEISTYPMKPIGIIQSCFSTRYGTPRQPLLVPIARAGLIFDPDIVPPASLEGLKEYSHCWIIYVFHLNTDLEKLWKPPSEAKFKAKVRVPRLKGGKMGVFATRSPHRPCPIGLTVAKVEAIQGTTVLLSGVDLVDGTPVLDIKPYLPFCDSIQEAKLPSWLTAENTLTVPSVSFSDGFSSSLAKCWETLEDVSLYASPDELKNLIKQVLSWDIRSVSQKVRPHNTPGRMGYATDYTFDVHSPDLEDLPEEDARVHIELAARPLDDDVVYHLLLEGMDVKYAIDSERNVVVKNVIVATEPRSGNAERCNYRMWADKLQ